MKILVIGGSYFLGRVFTMVAHKEHELTLVNRGNISMERYGVREYKADRHDVQALRNIPKDKYDAIVDFCAYNSEDIYTLIENMPVVANKYVLISTVDVYERHGGYIKDEREPLATTRYGGEIGDYIYGKICAEKALIDVCNQKKIDYTILRPAIIYGPNNYAPRESEFIKMALAGTQIKYPKGNEGKFQLVYVKDVAEAILASCKQTQSKAYNICSEIINYEKFMSALCKISDKPIECKAITTEEALKEATEGKVHLPFPVTIRETELYDGSKAERELAISYTSLEEGLLKTYNCYK